MNEGNPEQLRRLTAEKRWDHALALLRWLDPAMAADAFLSISFEDQEHLFRMMPVDLAATLVENLPYFHAYVLLRLRPTDEVHAIVDAMNPFAQLQLFEDLTSEAWRQLVGEAWRDREGHVELRLVLAIDKRAFEERKVGSEEVMAKAWQRDAFSTNGAPYRAR